MKRILVALDGTSHQRGVLDAAAAIAGPLGAKLILFHAVALPVHIPARALAVPPDEVSGLLCDDARASLEDLARTLPAALLECVQIEIGTAWRGVCETAKRDGADLVVVGSHPYGGADRLLGTTAAKVVDHAPCSVLVVRPAA